MYPDDESTHSQSLDGQVRFIHRAVRGSRAATLLVEERLTGLAGVIKANANSRTGEVYVVFEPGRITARRIVESLDEALR